MSKETGRGPALPAGCILDRRQHPVDLVGQGPVVQTQRLVVDRGLDERRRRVDRGWLLFLSAR